MNSKRLSIAGLVIILAVVARMVHAQTLDKFLYMPAVSMPPSVTPTLPPTPTNTPPPTIQPTPASTPISTQRDLRVVSYRYLGNSVIGEFQNNIADYVAVLSITVEFLDASGVVVATAIASPSHYGLEPGGKLPFSVGLSSDPQVYPGVQFKFWVYNLKLIPHLFPITQLQGSVSQDGNYYISGLITNDMPEDCSFWIWAVTLYDHNAKVIGVLTKDDGRPPFCNF